jgi:hypothetical protein
MYLYFYLNVKLVINIIVIRRLRINALHYLYDRRWMFLYAYLGSCWVLHAEPVFSYGVHLTGNRRYLPTTDQWYRFHKFSLIVLCVLKLIIDRYNFFFSTEKRNPYSGSDPFAYYKYYTSLLSIYVYNVHISCIRSNITNFGVTYYPYCIIIQSIL